MMTAFEIAELLHVGIHDREEAVEMIKEYARQACKEQRKICFNRWRHMPEWDDDDIDDITARAKIAIRGAPKPELK